MASSKQTSEGIETVLTLTLPYLTSVHSLHALLQLSKSARQAISDNLTPPSLFSILYNHTWPDRDVDRTLLLTYICPGFKSYLSSDTSSSDLLPKSHHRLFRQHCPFAQDSLLRLVYNTPAISSSAGLSLEELRSTWRERKAILVGLTDLIDRCVGVQWYAAPDFWDGGQEDAVTLFAEPAAAVLQIALWGEIFGKQGVQEYYDHLLSDQRDEREAKPETKGGRRSEERGGAGDEDDSRWSMPPALGYLDLSTRCEFVKYVLADWHTHIGRFTQGTPWGLASSYPASPVPSLLDIEDGSIVNKITDGQRATTSQVYHAEEDEVENVDEQDEPDTTGHDEDASLAARDPTENLMFEPLLQIASTDPSQGLPSDESEQGSEAEQTDGPAFSPQVHPLRYVHPIGPYDPNATGRNGQLEHASALLHLLSVSPLWGRIIDPLRQKIAAIARKEADPSGNSVQGHALTTPETEFGPTLRECRWEIAPRWKQLLWEDAMYTGGWDALDLIAGVWNSHPENTLSSLRASNREAEVGSTSKDAIVQGEDLSNGENPAVSTADSAWTVNISDDHPAVRRLVRIFHQLDHLDKEPQRVTLNSIHRPSRSVDGYLAPCLITDLRMAIWSPHIGQSWAIGRD